MSRIASCLDDLRRRGKKALIPFITAGDPTPGMTLPLMHALVAAGADIIELGVPFSDPMADGPTIQRASERALSYGVSLRTVLGMVREFREKDDETPIVLMGYANPIEAYGWQAFAQDAKASGVDGALTVDYPPEEASAFAELLHAQGIDPIFLLAPTSTPERATLVAELGSGYVYYVSLKGVTGSAALDLDDVLRRIPEIRERVGMPVGVGFGIRDAASAARIASQADGIVIGSRLIEIIEQGSIEEAPERAGAFLREIRAALDAVPTQEETR